MKMRSKRVILSLSVIAAALAVTSGGQALAGGRGRPPLVVAGTDTGHGGVGGSLTADLVRYERRDAALWCSEVGGYIDDALAVAEYATEGPGEVRSYLRQSIQNILAAYEAGDVPYQPLTYSLLQGALRIERVFPADADESGVSQGDQSASITLFHMLRAAKVVNTRFDVPRYVPFIREYRRCYHHPSVEGCGGYGEGYADQDPPFYVDYISSAREVLSMFFSPAIAERPYLGTVLDAMSHDKWELDALLEVIKWIQDDLRRDIFSRRLACLKAAIDNTRVRLEKYLSGIHPPFNDATMRMFTEDRLNDVRETLDRIHWQDGACLCR